MSLKISEPAELQGRDVQACRELTTPPIELMETSTTTYLASSNKDILFNVRNYILQHT